MRNAMPWRSVVAAFVAAPLMCGASLAYQGKGRVVGFVEDESGKPIQGVVLILRGEGLVEDARSGKSGVYELEWYPAGTYSVEVRAKGYLTQVKRNVKIQRDKDTRLDFVLRRGEQVKGTVVAKPDGSLKVKVGRKTMTFVVPKRSKLAALEVSQVNPGEAITVTWVVEDGKKYLKDIDARGTIIGEVTGLGDTWIEITPRGGKPQRLIPRWIGGAPARGGGFDKDILRKLRKLKVGAKVAVTWEMPEGRRVVEIKPVD